VGKKRGGLEKKGGKTVSKKGKLGAVRTLNHGQGIQIIQEKKKKKRKHYAFRGETGNEEAER